MTKQQRTPEELQAIQEALTSAATAQTFFYDALRDLEQTLGMDLDDLSTRDLENETVESLLASIEEEKREAQTMDDAEHEYIRQHWKA